MPSASTKEQFSTRHRNLSAEFPGRRRQGCRGIRVGGHGPAIALTAAEDSTIRLALIGVEAVNRRSGGRHCFSEFLAHRVVGGLQDGCRRDPPCDELHRRGLWKAFARRRPRPAPISARRMVLSFRGVSAWQDHARQRGCRGSLAAGGRKFRRESFLCRGGRTVLRGCGWHVHFSRIVQRRRGFNCSRIVRTIVTACVGACQGCCAPQGRSNPKSLTRKIHRRGAEDAE